MTSDVSLAQQIQNDLTQAMKAQDSLRLSTLRMMKTALHHQEVEQRGSLDSATGIQILQRMCKQRLDSIEQFEKGNRSDLADKERTELKIIQEYLPAAVEESAIRSAIEDVIRETCASSPKQMGLVMGKIMARFKGQAIDGNRVKQLVTERLNQTAG